MATKYTISDIKDIAGTFEGYCLSEEYKNSKEKLKFICKENHIFEKKIDSILKGSWCPECTKLKLSLKFRKYSINDMQDIAKLKGGICLSSDYINRRLPLKWKCEKGHIWETAFGNIMSGNWCPTCGRNKASENRKKYSLTDIQEIAYSKDGICLSESYSTIRTILTFKCKNGHIWKTEANQILKGNWCPYCSGTMRKNIEEIREVAKKRGGNLLSTKYINAHSKLQWECSNGHSFEANYNNVRAGKWCPKCRINFNEDKCRFILENITGYSFPKRRDILPNLTELDGYSDILNIAFEYQGRQHYEFIKFFHRNENALKSQIERDKAKKEACKQANINLIEIPYTLETDESKVNYLLASLQSFGVNINKNTNVSELLKDFYSINTKLTELQQLAISKKGTLLSQEYNGYHTNLSFQCEKGHVWEASPANILAGKWCRKCAQKAIGFKLKATIEEMQTLGNERGGTCLSMEYKDAKSKLLWKCGKGHLFKMTPDNIKQGKWCPNCAKEKRKLTIENMKELAQRKKGYCLTEIYENNNTKMLWECEKGHKWEARPREIKRGIWCPTCGSNKLTIEDMQKLAHSKNGTCLSEIYVNSNTSLTWECNKGHRWKARPSNIKTGTWCPICAGTNKKTIKDMQNIAHLNGGKCLSDTYINSDTKLIWQCKNQHIWEATPYLVNRKGKWCPYCLKENN